MQNISPHRLITSPLPLEQQNALFENEGRTNFRDYWVSILKYRWMILVFFLIALLIAVLARVMAEPVYTATTTLQIQSRMPNITGVPEISTSKEGGLVEEGEEYYETQFNLLRSRSLAARVIQTLGIENDPRFRTGDSLIPWIRRQQAQIISAIGGPIKRWIQERLGSTSTDDKAKPEVFELGVHPDLVNRYLGMLAVNPIPKSQLVEISYTSVDPAFSKEVVNAHAASFIRMSLQTRFELTTEARQFLDEKLKELKAKVEQSEETLNRFRKMHGIVSLEKGENLLVERLMSLNRELTEARAKRIELESISHVVQQRDHRLLSQVIDNRFVEQLKDQIANLELEQSRLATKFKPTYPGVASLQNQINEGKGRLDRELSRIVRTIESDYMAAKAKEEALTGEMEKQKQEALELREQMIEYAILEKEVESNRTLYDNVLNKTKETALAGEVPVSNMLITDRAEIPLEPDGPSGARNLLAILVIGLFGGVGLAFLRSYADNTLTTSVQIEQYLHLPTLGIVPDFSRLPKRGGRLNNGKRYSLFESPSKKLQGNGRDLVISHHPFSLVAEAYRVVRTAVLFARAEKPPQTILITSAQANEGKTVTAINTAISLAETDGGPVLLIDADLRNGQCHRLLGLENKRGLTNILTGNDNLSELTTQTTIDRLYFLSSGERSPNPAELLGSEKMRETLEYFGETFSYIVIDSAPLLPIVDTVLLAPLVDGVVLVARGSKVSRSMISQARERLNYVGAKILGVILNGIDIHSPEYKEYKSSYSSYYTSDTLAQEAQ